jgi:hypothetical protein
LAFALAPLVLSACGSDRGHDPSEDGDDSGTSGSRATGGASGTGGATGGTAGGGAPGACRLYASRYVRENAGTETSYTCAFDRPSLTLSCTDGDDVYSTRDWSDTWARIEDAVQDNRPLGKHTLVRSTEWSLYADLGIVCDFTFDYAYDSLGRLTSIVSTPVSESCITSDVYYDSWDDEGRPTRGIATAAIGPCSEVDVTYEYDDANRTILSTSVGVGTECESRRSQSTWDENGLVLSVSDQSGNLYRYTTLETGEICRGGG